MLEDLVKDFFAEKGMDVTISTYNLGEKLLEGNQQGSSSDIYIVDMIMPGLKGIDVGRELRNRNDHGKLIYLTATSEYAVDSYSVGAFYYMLKPISRKKVWEVLEKAVAEVLRERLDRNRKPIGDKHYEIKSREGKCVVNIRDIRYVDIVNRGLCYHMADEKEYFGPMLRSPFAEAVASLTSEKGFRQIGSSLVVNLSSVVMVDREHIVLDNGVQLFPAKSACAELFELLRS